MLRDTFYFVLVLLISTCYSCKKGPSTLAITSSEQFPTFKTKGKVIPQDSLKPPRTIQMKDLERVKSGPPKTIIVDDDEKYLTGLLEEPFAQSKVETPGVGTCQLPKDWSYTINRVKVGTPNKVLLKEPKILWDKDKLLSIYAEPQGITSGNITDIMEDSHGYLWMCSALLGIMKFDGRHVYTYSLKHGLKGNITSQMCQDKHSGIWIGTNRGVSHLDGINFTNYDFKSDLLNVNGIIGIVQDKSENLWMAGSDGLYKMNPNDHRSIKFNDDSGLLKNQVGKLYTDSNGRIWITYQNGGLSILEIDEEASNPYSFHHIMSKDDTLSTDIADMLEDNEGNIWLATHTGILLLNDAMNTPYDKMTITKISTTNGLQSSYIMSIEQNHATQEIYIAMHKGGLGTIKKESDQYQYKYYPKIDARLIATLYCDSQNTIWEGTRFGLFKISRNPFNIIDLSNDDVVFQPTRFAEDKWGRIWLGSYGGGVFLYEPKTDITQAKLHQFNRLNGMRSSFVDDIVGDQKGNLWIGLRDYGLIKMELDEGAISGTFTNYLEQKNFPAGFVPNMMLDENDDLWCALYEYGPQKTAGICRVRDDEILHIGIDQGLISDDSWEFDHDKNGDIWVGSSGHGITKYNYTSDTTRGHATHFTYAENLLGMMIWSLTVDKNKSIWAGANGGDGLVHIETNGDDSTYAIRHITTSEGLIHNNITALAEDHSGDMWVGSNGGLSHITTAESQDKTTITNYTQLDGLAPGGVFFNGMYQDADSTIWVRTNSKLLSFKKENLKRNNTIPNVVLTNIYLYNEKVNWEKESPFYLKNGIEISDVTYDSLNAWYDVPNNLKLRHDNNYISFEFQGISINVPHRLRYSYQLEGWSDRWSVESEENVAVFGTLDPGEYVFKVKVKYELGPWSQPTTYTFTIRPPWWKSWWAYILYCLIFISSIGLFLTAQVRRARWKIKLLEEVRTNISVDLHDDVGTIMSGVAMQAEYVAAAQPEDIETEMNQISSMSREAIEKMRDIVWALDPRKDKYENLIDRMHSFAEVMFGSSKFEYEFNINGISGQKFISPDLRRNIYLIYKEALQNISKHSNGDYVKIDFVKNEYQFSLSIHDNGQVISETNSDGLGVSNMKLRAQNVGVSLKIINENGYTIKLDFLK